MDAKEFKKAKNEYIEALFIDPHLPGIDRRVVGVLAMKFYNQEKGFAWPSVKTLAELLAVDRTTIQRSIHRLVETGWLAVEKGGKGPKTPHEYRPIWAMGRVEMVADKGGTAMQPLDAPLRAAPVHAKGGISIHDKGGTAMQPNSFEVIPIKTPRASDSSPAQEDSPSNTELFPGTSKIETTAKNTELVATTTAPAAQQGQKTNNVGTEFEMADSEPEPSWKLRTFRAISSPRHPSGIAECRFESLLNLRQRELESAGRLQFADVELNDNERRRIDDWLMDNPEIAGTRALEKLQSAHEAEVKKTTDRLERQRATKFATGLG